jgi:hypothetical protein
MNEFTVPVCMFVCMYVLSAEHNISSFCSHNLFPLHLQHTATISLYNINWFALQVQPKSWLFTARYRLNVYIPKHLDYLLSSGSPYKFILSLHYYNISGGLPFENKSVYDLQRQIECPAEGRY